MAAGVSWVALLSFSLLVPGQGLTCDTGCWLSEGVSSPSPVSLEDFIFYWFSLGPFPELSVADGLRPSDPKDSSKAGVGECLDRLQCRSRGILHVSAPYSRTGFTVVLKILILILMAGLGEAQMFFSLSNTALALSVISLHWHQSPLVCLQCYRGRWNLSPLLIHLPPVLWGLWWLFRCSWGPCS